MNIIDYIIIAIIAVNVIFGLHRGFINGVLSLAALIISVFIALGISGQIADGLKKNDVLVNTLQYYTDAGSKIRDTDKSMLSVNQLSDQEVDSILKQANLPSAIQNIFRDQIRKGRDYLGKTVSQTMSGIIVEVSISIISFLICFVVIYIILSLLVNMIVYVFKLPILRHFDALIGGIFGFIRGILIVYVIFAIVPLILTVAPVEQIQQLFDQSFFVPYFDSRIITSIFSKI